MKTIIALTIIGGLLVGAGFGLTPAHLPLLAIGMACAFAAIALAKRQM